jgi:hypothetical protein
VRERREPAFLQACLIAFFAKYQVPNHLPAVFP